jgi:hypothetical protein
MYDASRISDQTYVLDELHARRPPYLIWARTFVQDGVPYNIRTPLLYTWMVRNFVPVRSFSTADVLRRRAPGEAIPVSYWTTQFGSTIDLGYIPSLSGAATAPPCRQGPGCTEYALARGRAKPGTIVTLDVTGNDHTLRVAFAVRSGVSTYPVRLDRLWFSPIVGASPVVRSMTPGFTASTQRLRSGDNLY